MLGECENGKVCHLVVLDKDGCYAGRSIFLNFYSPTFSKCFCDITSKYEVLVSFDESLEVHYESRFNK